MVVITYSVVAAGLVIIHGLICYGEFVVVVRGCIFTALALKSLVHCGNSVAVGVGVCVYLM